MWLRYQVMQKDSDDHEVCRDVEQVHRCIEWVTDHRVLCEFSVALCVFVVNVSNHLVMIMTR